MEWDLWVDYQRTDGQGLTHANLRNAAPGVVVEPGAYLVVGNEEADSAVAQVVSLDDQIVLLRVLPGSVEEHHHLVTARRAS